MYDLFIISIPPAVLEPADQARHRRIFVFLYLCFYLQLMF